MDLQHLIDADEPFDVSTPNDNAASTSSIVNQELGPLGHPEDPRDQLTQEASVENFTLQPMETA